MGSSVKKKKEKKKDFQKPKLKVGKARPKAANQTDTSFQAKAIVLNQQLNVDAPSIENQFHHHVSLLSSRSDSQRKESLAYLTTFLYTKTKSGTLPIPTSSLLDKICPLLLDGTSGVRAQLLKLFQTLPSSEVQDNVSKILPYVRAGMTHLSKEVRVSSVDFLSWLVSSAGLELVSCPGGWYKTLECFTTILSWRALDTGKWSAAKPALGDAKSTARVMVVLSEFLQAGLHDQAPVVSVNDMAECFPSWHTQYHTIPSKSNAFAYLSLFGPPRDEENQMLEDVEDRIRVYNKSFRPLINTGIKASRQEGGELGRAAGSLVKTLARVQSG